MIADISPHRSNIRRLVASHGACNPRLIEEWPADGVAAILVDLKPGTSGADMTRLHSELEDLLGGRIGLLTPRDVPARQRAATLKCVQTI